MSQLLEDLQAVRRKIEDPEHWTSWAFARDRYGRPVGPRDSTAVSYCIYGAMGVVAGVTTTKRFVALSDCILPICPDPGWGERHSWARSDPRSPRPRHQPGEGSAVPLELREAGGMKLTELLLDLVERKEDAVHAERKAVADDAKEPDALLHISDIHFYRGKSVAYDECMRLLAKAIQEQIDGPRRPYREPGCTYG